MREYLFHGKRKNINKWVEGTGIFFDGINTWLFSHDSTRPVEYDMEKFIVEPESVGQYTGMADKNGKKIFEGDILDTPDRLIKVVWLKGNAQFDLEFVRYAHDKIITNFSGIEMRDLKEYEVVGNVFENKDLLEG